jgi:hypothetical protein
MVAPVVLGLLAVVGGATTAIALYKCCWRTSTSLSKTENADTGKLTKSVDDFLTRENPYSKDTHGQNLVFRRTGAAAQGQAVGS